MGKKDASMPQTNNMQSAAVDGSLITNDSVGAEISKELSGDVSKDKLESEKNDPELGISIEQPTSGIGDDTPNAKAKANNDPESSSDDGLSDSETESSSSSSDKDVKIAE